MYTFSELIWNIRKVGKIDSRKIQGQSAFTCCLTQDVFKIISYKPYFVVDFVASDKLESSLDGEF